MSNRFMTKRKIVTVIIASVLTAVIVLSGTFAWQSISQTALNEVAASVNPGGRLHDDFNDITDIKVDKTRVYDKDVYVENFTSYWDNGVQIFARVRLDEYMEIGANAGELNEKGDAPADDNKAQSLVSGAELADKSTWTPHVPNNPDDPFHDYWEWDIDGGKTVYMPTFNKNKDSLVADINGSSAKDFSDYTKYELGKTETGPAIYDGDDNTADELGDPEGKSLSNFLDHIDYEEETHEAKETIDGKVYTMAQYIEWLNDDDPDNDRGDFWVYDTDGWAYWANPIDPDTATGLLLSGISRTETYINQDWYYGINVVAQFITADDIGSSADNDGLGSGFYDSTQGKPPTNEAILLLDEIGVAATYKASTAEDVTKALAAGTGVELTGEISGATAYAPTYTDSTGAAQTCNFDVNYAVTNGTTVSGGTLNIDTPSKYGLFLWTESGNGADNVRGITVKDTVINNTAAKVGVYTQALNAHCELNGVTVNSKDGIGIVSELHGDYDLILNDCTVTQSGVTDSAKPWTETAVATCSDGSIVINSGTYESTGWAVYAFSSGGTITINGGTFIGNLGCDAGELIINGGTFNGDLSCNAGELIIKGGNFSVNPSAYVDAEAYTVTTEADGTFTVAANTVTAK